MALWCFADKRMSSTISCAYFSIYTRSRNFPIREIEKKIFEKNMVDQGSGRKKNEIKCTWEIFVCMIHKGTQIPEIATMHFLFATYKSALHSRKKILDVQRWMDLHLQHCGRLPPRYRWSTRHAATLHADCTATKFAHSRIHHCDHLYTVARKNHSVF